MNALVFDLDGTLVDTKYDMLDAGNLVFESQGWETRLKGFVGLQTAIQGGRAILRYGLGKEGIDFDEKLLNDYYQLYLSNYDKVLDNRSVVYNGVTDTLSQLQATGVKLGLCTNKPEKHARELLKRLGLVGFFESSFVGSDTVGVAKPDWEKNPVIFFLSVIQIQTKEPRKMRMLTLFSVSMVMDSYINLQWVRLLFLK